MRFHFGEFCLDIDRRELSKDGLLIHLTPKALQLLRLLIEHRPKVLAKEEIQLALWPGTFVEESNLSVLVSEVRQALGDAARKPRFIRTAHGFGYGFIAHVRNDVGDDVPSSPIRLRHGTRELVLVEGENIVGRDAVAQIRLTGPGISRKHARIVVNGDLVTIEDLGSKNGTYVDGRRLESVTDLLNGSEILVSRELLVVQVAAQIKSTITEMR